MKAGLLLCFALLFVTCASAHRLDEYLQATRVLVATNRVDLSIDLTPGVAVVDQLVAIIDKNHDGLISEGEQREYSQRCLKDILLKLDEKPLAARLVAASFPTLFELKSGVGVIHISATASAEHLIPGKHTLRITNAHLPAISVYLVNALTSKDPAIQITKQTRDESQKDYRLDFEVIAAVR